ncbi:MAG TPA: folate-binding protein YgfZ [Leptolyngbyaceae cyanobacterium M33_DOE_097]|uniref:Folate-binding protein n=1 Tax=Oscillatoriales cyanobacterium SpSt-418 TaxID=2282169 RepID=A0A7C3PJW9_9CYAN|nr:folate-binding protein YgfZ [Leptolyngbyaceae cyanobacterium M33_DOE_097]
MTEARQAPQTSTSLTADDVAAIAAARDRVAIYDTSHWGRLQLTDRDRLTFLHNQTTNDFKALQPGQGCQTIFVTSTARTIDLATAYVLEDAIIVQVSPNRREYLMKWLDRYIFFGDRVQLADITDSTACITILGSESDSLLNQLQVPPLAEQVEAYHQLVELAGVPVRIAVGTNLGLPGYTLILPVEQRDTVWQTLLNASALPLSDRAWEVLRVQQGRPLPDQELTEDFNAVEACLWQAISLNKGCYIGQETIARLDTYKGVKQQIWGIRLSQLVEPETPIQLGEEKVGKLTSVTTTPTEVFGLGYVRTKAAGAGAIVQIGEAEGTLVEVPFLQRDRTNP